MCVESGFGTGIHLPPEQIEILPILPASVVLQGAAQPFHPASKLFFPLPSVMCLGVSVLGLSSVGPCSEEQE